MWYVLFTNLRDVFFDIIIFVVLVYLIRKQKIRKMIGLDLP